MNIVFAGTPEFALPSLQALLASEHRVLAVYTQPDRSKGRGRHLSKSPIGRFALDHNIPIRQPQTLSDVNVQRALAELQPDLMVVVAYGLILTRAVLDIPTFGCINVHASLLPRWRGAAPIQRAILAGDKETGISIMRMDEGLDTGPVLQKTSCPIEEKDTSQTLEYRLAELGAKALSESLRDLPRRYSQAEVQRNQESSYAKKIDKQEAEIFWQQDATTIDRVIRAFNPQPIAYTFLNQLPLRVWAGEIRETSAPANRIMPGTILRAKPEGIDVMTGNGIIRLLEIQLPGGRHLPVAELLHSKSHLFLANTYLGRSPI